ncbi:MAG TPA: sugar ABC transporter ATP-binding protein [Marmoricola sp.]|jgi:simple sugar transport system ATP-binding protein/ribose transport system ATP-binding protein|nr:sugar ABC transporter ATP-binding protein [Marmoricola sp.]
MTALAADRPTPMVELVGVSKRFGGAVALADIDLELREAEVHCLVGENGAGKSTLGKVIAGVHRADTGSVAVRGQEVDFKSPRDSLGAGIAFIAQELAIVPERSVLENVFLGGTGHGLRLVGNRRLLAEYEQLTAKAGFAIDPRARAGSLRLADQQKVEILRALARDADVIIMDEPTASLAGAESDQLLEIIRDLKREGRTVVFVTHFLVDALAVADRVTVLKDGRLVRTSEASTETPDTLIESMLGRSLGSMFPSGATAVADERALRVSGLSRSGEFDEISLDVRRGEIVGIAGLVGAGRTELLETLVGLRRPSRGTVEVDGRPCTLRSPEQAKKVGLVMVPESRKDHGLVLGRTVRENVCLPHLASVSRLGFVAKSQQADLLEGVVEKVGLDANRIDSPVGQLSGGNQQKVMFARWLCQQPTVFLADEPTRGVDVGARAAIYQLMRDVADQGAGVLFVSSDNEEVVGLADRVLVMRAGRIVGELSGADINEDAVLGLMFHDDLREEAI